MEKSFGFMDFSNLDAAWRCAQFISKSGEFCPRDYRDNAPKVLCAIQYGLELGKSISPMQALWGVKIINGVPTIPGELCLALCLASGQVENIKQFYNEDKTAATFVLKRKGFDEMSYTYTKEDAIRAGLWGKGIKSKDGRQLPSPWQTNPDLMLMHRAKGIVMKAICSDILKGMVPQEVAEDYVDFGSYEKKENSIKQCVEPEVLGANKLILIDDKKNDNSVMFSENSNIVRNSTGSYTATSIDQPKINEEALEQAKKNVQLTKERRDELEEYLFKYIHHFNIPDETIEKWKQYFKINSLLDLSDNDLTRLVNKLES